MWGWFFAACVIESLLLVIPGTLLLRAAGLARVDALCLSPMVSLVLYGVAGVLFSAVVIPCTTLTVAVPLILVALAVWLALRHRRPWQEPTSLKEVAGELRLPALYVAVGVVAAMAVLVGSLGRPDSFIQTWDNVCHFNLIRAFVDSHEWSTLATTYYPGAASAFDPFPGTQGYYPAGWHLLGALAVDALGVPVTLAANVVNAVVVGVVWPLGACALMRQLFEGRLARVCGAVCCCVFPAFPWNLIERWTLYPNLLAFALLPMALTALLMLTAEGQTRRGRLRAAVIVVASGASLCLAQPNAGFSAVLFAVPYGAWRIWWWRFPRRGLAHALICVGAALCLSAAAWVALCLAPFLQGVVGFFWKPMISSRQAFEGIVGGSFIGGDPQPLLTLVLAVGIVVAWRQHKRWLVAAFALASASFFVAATGADSALKHLVAGFWYTDPYRLGATATVFAVPLAALGLAALAELAARGASALAVRMRDSAPHSKLSPCARVAVVASFAVAAIGPAALVSAGLTSAQYLGDLGWVAHGIAKRCDARGRFGFNEEKIAFAARARELVGPSAMVLNEPFDGSVYAYGVSGLNVMWRYMSGYDESEESEASVALRSGLVELSGTDADSEEVRKALEETGAEYLLRLGGTPTGERPYFEPFHHDDWEGVLAVDDETPGFDVVLAEGNMRLYRIVR